ncbi:MAG: hypothetical protein QGG50_03320 [Methanopyri archaeon]|nr:hypothetical protein [Methanopyri archaeon]
MEVEIVEKNENLLLARTEVRFRIDHKAAGTPPIGEVRAQLASALKAKKELLIVNRYETTFGIDSCEGNASIYKDASVLSKVETIATLRKNGLIKDESEEKKEEAPKEKKAEEKKEEKAEEKKEKAPKEEKTEEKKEKAPKEEKAKEKKEKAPKEKKAEEKKEKAPKEEKA